MIFVRFLTSLIILTLPFAVSAHADDAKSLLYAQSQEAPDAEKDRDEADARALEEAQREASGTELPPLSEDRAERLDQLFAVLQTATTDQLRLRAVQEIEGIWANSGSATIDLLIGWANEATREQNYGEALDYLDNVVRLKPDYAEGWNKRATVYFLQRDYNRSIADVERVLELEPRHFGAMAGLGIMLVEYGKDAQALDFFKRAFALNPTLERLEKRIETLSKKVDGQKI